MTKPALSVKAFFEQEAVQKRFEKLMGENAPSFILSVLQVVNSNDKLAKADPVSIYNSAAVAATLNLPLSNALGLAYIVPYDIKTEDGWKTVAQFQIGYRGFVQLAHRTNQFERLNVTDVREGEIRKYDYLSGDLQFDWVQDQKAREALPIVGYVSYMKLSNGFEKMLYMPVSKLIDHGKRFSKTFAKDKGLWKDDFDSMAKKTPLKLMLSKWAPLSLDLQRALVADQGIIKNEETLEVDYTDNPKTLEEKEDEEERRIKLLIAQCNTLEQLNELQGSLPPEFDTEHIRAFFTPKREELSNGK